MHALTLSRSHALTRRWRGCSAQFGPRLVLEKYSFPLSQFRLSGNANAVTLRSEKSQIAVFNSVASLVVFALGALLLILSGCGGNVINHGIRQEPQTSFDRPGTNPNPVIDAGIIFEDEANYLCVPLSRFGIEGDEPIDVQSSCECLMPSVVRMKDSRGGPTRALRVDFVSKKSAASESAISLAVAVKLKRKFGPSVAVSIHFLQTKPIAE